MRYFILLSAVLFAAVTAQAQNVGIGTANPTEKLDVAGAIKIAGTNNTSPAKGTVRWNDARSDFEGYNGFSWVSLTGGKSAWGNQATYSSENDASGLLLTYYNKDKYGVGLGTSIATAGSRMVVGAPFNFDENINSVNAPELGSVVYYYWNLHQWVADANFMPLTFSGRELVGYSVSISGDRIAAGAPGADINGKIRQGRVLMLPYYPSGRDNFISLVASDGAAGDQFGLSVSLSGNNLLIGAPYKKIGANNMQGKAYFFQPFLNTWVEAAQFTAPDGTTGALFGKQVVVDGNWAAVAAPEASGSIPKAGKVYLYQRSNSTWVYHSALQPEGSESYFGTALHLKNDTLVIGIPGYLGSTSGGRVKVYVRSGNTWNLQAGFAAPDPQQGDVFGTSVNRMGNVLLVGAPGADVGANSNQGKAYVFRLNGASWVHEATLAASNGKAYDYFGTAAVLTPYTANVGAPTADIDGRINNGDVYFYKHQSQNP